MRGPPDRRAASGLRVVRSAPLYSGNCPRLGNPPRLPRRRGKAGFHTHLAKPPGIEALEGVLARGA